MPAPGSALLIATALIVGGLVIGLAVIVTLLMRISSALADASSHLGSIPGQLDPLGPAVSRINGSLALFRSHIEQTDGN